VHKNLLHFTIVHIQRFTVMGFMSRSRAGLGLDTYKTEIRFTKNLNLK